MTGIGLTGSETSGWEYRYYGQQTRTWSRAVDQRPALVGSIIRSKSHGVSTRPWEASGPRVGAAAGYVAPFIAVEAPFVAVKQITFNHMTLNSTAFQQAGGFPPYARIPKKYTAEGEDVSPPLAWEGVPDGAKSLVLIIDDPDARDPQAPEMVWVHWVVYNIPPDTKSLPENVGVGQAQARLPQGASLGRNDSESTEYSGPNPPIGRHRYFHKLYALDIKLNLTDATKSQIEKAVRGHVLADAYLIGTYQKGDR